MARNQGRTRRQWRYERAVTRQIEARRRYEAGEQRHMPAPPEEFLRPGDQLDWFMPDEEAS